MGTSTKRWIIIGSAAAAVIIVVIALVIWPRGTSTPVAAGTDAAVASTPAATPAPTPTPAPTSNAVASPHPSSCDEIFSPALVAELNTGNKELNPTWLAADSKVRWASRDDSVRSEFDASENLSCVWAGDPSNFYVSTNVRQVTPAEADAALAVIRNAGIECTPTGDATRCLSVWYSQADAPVSTVDMSSVDDNSGESHYLRDGLWITTVFTNYATRLDAYEADVNGMLWPAG